MAPHNTAHRGAAIPPDQLLTTEAAAARVGLSPVTLKVWRWQRNPHAPPHITVGARNIRYSAAAIEEWKAARTHRPGRKKVPHGGNDGRVF
jgi:predicted DNA-binding transcriptional regulator AlpA